MLLVLLGAVEAALRVREGYREVTPAPQPVKDHFHRIVVPDAQLRYAGLPNADFTDEIVDGGVVVQETRYRLGDDGFRITPMHADPLGDCDVYFFGCSFTFGFGVQDDETLPAQFGASQPRFRVKNYAFPGYGPQQFWLLMQRPSVVGPLSGRRGVVLYVHIDHHLNRLIGTPDLKDWYATMPWLYLQDGKVVSGGDFDDRDRFIKTLDRELSGLALYRLAASRVRRILPSIEAQCTSPSNRALYVAVIRDAREKLRAISPDLEFCFVVYPGAEQAEPICAALESAGIRTLDYSHLFDGHYASAVPLWIPESMGTVGGHPVAAGHAIVVEQLVQDLPKLFPERMAACGAEPSGS